MRPHYSYLGFPQLEVAAIAEGIALTAAGRTTVVATTRRVMAATIRAAKAHLTRAATTQIQEPAITTVITNRGAVAPGLELTGRHILTEADRERSAMGSRFQRRINLGGGAGLNLSKSGVSSSVRTRFGSVGTKGFSIRTGVPGLTYRGRYRKGSDGGLIVVLVLALVALLPLLFQALVLVVRLLLVAVAWMTRVLIIAPVRILRDRIEMGGDAPKMPPLSGLPHSRLSSPQTGPARKQ
jgi:hypothetical protein